MMLEKGFGGGDPRGQLVQLHEALLRDCRFMVGIKLHTQGMSIEQGAKVFVEKGFQEPANAYEEALHGVQPYLPVLHLRKVANLQATRRLSQGPRPGVQSATFP
jgi:hypothetical protein